MLKTRSTTGKGGAVEPGLPSAGMCKKELRPTASELDKIPRIGRGRFLSLLSKSLFGGAAIVALKTTPAYAHTCPRYTPSPCFGFPKCYCCSAYACCSSSCTPANGYCPDRGPYTGSNYWSSCHNGYYYICADFNEDCHGSTRFCLCRFWTGTSC